MKSELEIKREKEVEAAIRFGMSQLPNVEPPNTTPALKFPENNITASTPQRFQASYLYNTL